MFKFIIYTMWTNENQTELMLGTVEQKLEERIVSVQTSI